MDIFESINWLEYGRLIMTIVFFTVFFTIVCKCCAKQWNLPPGPWGFPIIGSLLRAPAGSPHAWYARICAKYGNLASVKLGYDLVVIIGSAGVLRELFNKPDSTNRPDTPLNNLMGGRGIVLSQGLLWRKQRQFLHEKFRSIGVKLYNNKGFEPVIMTEVKEFLSFLERTDSKPVNPSIMLGRHMHNVICQIMMSFRFEEGDPEFLVFNERVSKGMETFGSLHIGEHLPFYFNLPGKRAIFNQIVENLKAVSEFHQKHLYARREMLRNTDLDEYKPKDLLDYYLIELIKNGPQPGNDGVEASKSFNKLFHGVDPEQQIIQVMNDLFSAGMETSRNTLVWILVMMLREPDVCNKVRFELEQVLKPGELVTLEHRCKLPYLEAVIFETLRIVSVVPLGTTHVNQFKWYTQGYTIPAGSHLVPLLHKINMDPELFPEPEKFTPERFIDNGKLIYPDVFMPFGVGRRVCAGEQLARVELFLFFANLMNNFEFHLPLGHPKPGLNGIVGTTHAPKPFGLSFTKMEYGFRSSQHA